MQSYTFFHKPLFMPRIYINSIIICSAIASCQSWWSRSIINTLQIMMVTTLMITKERITKTIITKLMMRWSPKWWWWWWWWSPVSCRATFPLSLAPTWDGVRSSAVSPDQDQVMWWSSLVVIWWFWWFWHSWRWWWCLTGLTPSFLLLELSSKTPSASSSSSAPKSYSSVTCHVSK